MARNIMGYFERIEEQNKTSLNKPLDVDRVYYSELTEWYTENAFRSLSLKYVVDQHIYYRIDNREHRVDAGHYMLASKYSDVKAYFSSPKSVKSICIDICPKSFAEAFTVITSANTDIDNLMAGYFTQPHFYESISPALADPLGAKLSQLHSAIALNELETVNREWFLDLVEKIVYKEYGNYLSLKNIHSAKPCTRKEILRRLHISRRYMDE